MGRIHGPLEIYLFIHNLSAIQRIMMDYKKISQNINYYDKRKRFDKKMIIIEIIDLNMK